MSSMSVVQHTPSDLVPIEGGGGNRASLLTDEGGHQERAKVISWNGRNGARTRVALLIVPAACFLLTRERGVIHIPFLLRKLGIICASHWRTWRPSISWLVARRARALS